MVLGVYFAFSSGTVDSIVYDTVLEETGSSAEYEKWIGRVRIVESAALVASALLGGLLAGWVSARFTYYATVPFALLSVVAFLVFDEPRLHRQSEPAALRQHVASMFRIMTREPRVRRVILLAALAAMAAQAVFEFGPLWLVAVDAPAAAYGPYWAALVASLGVAGYLTSKLRLHRRRNLLVLAVAVAAIPVPLALTDGLVAIVVAQTGLAVLVGIVGIHAGLLVHDAVSSQVRAGVASGIGTLSWLLFVPFSLFFGWLVRAHGVGWAGWVLTGVAVLLAVLLAVSARASAAPRTTSRPRRPSWTSAGGGVPAGAERGGLPRARPAGHRLPGRRAAAAVAPRPGRAPGRVRRLHRLPAARSGPSSTRSSGWPRRNGRAPRECRARRSGRGLGGQQLALGVVEVGRPAAARRRPRRRPRSAPRGRGCACR